ncbi:hypothetical protein [Ferrimonas kyonanensis]|uniref:hypothetical protein n=1 Tax=Ferrimonas kyonanensis TaxID=364763 RepID=UPI00040499F4|nr:hypothetical protein [Ferrimonas kyonanensis]
MKKLITWGALALCLVGCSKPPAPPRLPSEVGEIQTVPFRLVFETVDSNRYASVVPVIFYGSTLPARAVTIPAGDWVSGGQSLVQPGERYRLQLTATGHYKILAIHH